MSFPCSGQFIFRDSHRGNATIPSFSCYEGHNRIYEIVVKYENSKQKLGIIAWPVDKHKILLASWISTITEF